MSRAAISAALAVFVVLTVVLGASTAYLLASPMGQTHTTTSTLVSVSTSTLTETTTSVSVSVSGSGYTVGIAYKAGIGFYLVDSSGMTLYFRTADIHSNGTSTCVGQCSNIWPVFFTQSLVLPPGLNASSFTVVTRADGTKQIDYNNWPLYHYSGDSAPGDTNGQGIEGIWFAYTLPSPSQVTTSTSTTPSTSTSTTSSMTSTSSVCTIYCY